MIPEFFHIGPFPIRSYGVMIAFSFALGIWLAVRRGTRRGMDGALLTDLSIAILVSSIVGARVLYILPYWDEFAANPARIFAIWQGGLTMYGGLLGAVAASVLFMRAKKMPFWEVSDVVAPSVALGLAVTRIGCFLNGCCFGLPTHLAWGVRFPPHSAAGAEFYGVPIHPAQLYDSLVGFCLFGILLAAEGRLRGKGRLFILFVGLYGLSRFFMDRVRFYENVSAGSLGGIVLTWNQWLSVFLFAGAAVLFVLRGRKT
ncbi:MAG: prolipoprotein diacylglyceryl transferase [Candidatus Eisenbacteria bacterium]